MKIQDYAVKARRLSEQLNSAGVMLSYADASVQSALSPKLDEIGWQVQEASSKAEAYVANTGGLGSVGPAEEQALDMAGAALAALMLEVEKNLSADQQAQAAKFAVGTQVGQKDLYADEEDYKTAMTKAVAALQPTVADLAKVSPAQSEALMGIMSVQKAVANIPWKPVAIVGALALVVWAGTKWRGRRGSAPPVARLPKFLRGRIKGILKFKGA